MLSFPESRLGSAQECPHCSETLVVSPADSGTDGKLPVPIQTQRLLLRPLRDDDLSDWLELVTDEDSYKYFHFYAPSEEEASSGFEQNRRLRPAQPNGHLALGIQLQNEAKIIGGLWFYLTDPEEHRQGTFRIIIHPAFRGKGFGAEALMGLLDFGLNGLAMHDIRVTIDSENKAGRRMAERAGMKLEGEMTEERRIKGEWRSMAYYGMLAGWWQQKAASQ